MDPDEESQQVPDDEGVDEVESPSESAPVEDAGADESRPLSMEEAWAQAEAALAARDGGTPEESPAEGGAAEGASEAAAGDEALAAPASGGQPARTYTRHGALDSILTLIEQGRHGELSQEELGLVNRFAGTVLPTAKQQIQEEQLREQFFREQFLQYDALRINDPAAFAELLASDVDPDSGVSPHSRFYNLYKRDHPEVSADNPDGPDTFSRDQLDASVREAAGQERQRARGAVEKVVKGLAADYGVNYDQLAASVQNQPMSALVKVVEQAVASGVERQLNKERPALEASIRDALLKETQARFNGHQIITPRPLREIVRDPSVLAKPTGPLTMAESMELAEKQLEAMGR